VYLSPPSQYTKFAAKHFEGNDLPTYVYIDTCSLLKPIPYAINLDDTKIGQWFFREISENV